MRAAEAAGFLVGAALLAACAPSRQPESPLLVVVEDARFELSGALATGPRTIEFRNASDESHAVLLAGHSIILGPRASRRIAVALDPGAYDLRCVTHGIGRSILVAQN